MCFYIQQEMSKIFPLAYISIFLISVLVINWCLYSFLQYPKLQNEDSCSYYNDSCMQLLLANLELVESTSYLLDVEVDTGAVKHCFRGVGLNNQCSSVTNSTACLVIKIGIDTEEEDHDIEVIECYFNYTKCASGVDNEEDTRSVVVSVKNGTLNMTVDNYKNHSNFDFNIRHIFSMLYNCDSLEEMKRFPSYVLKLQNIFRRTFTVAATLILAFTLLIYALVPSLRKGYGKSIMSYAAAKFFKHFLLGLLKIFIPKDSSSFIVHFIMEAKYFADLSSHAWQIIIAYQIWTGFKSRQPPYTQNNKQFLVHSVLAWGLCLLVVLAGAVVIALIDRSPLDNMSSKSQGYVLLKVVAIAPLLLAEGAGTLFCVPTLYRIWAEHRASRWAWSCGSQRHNRVDVRWSSVFIKISFITGVNCVIVNIFMIFNNVYLFSNSSNIFPVFLVRTLKDINNLTGVEIFFIFVLKQKTWDLLRNRFLPKEMARSNKVAPSQLNISLSSLS